MNHKYLIILLFSLNQSYGQMPFQKNNSVLIESQYVYHMNMRNIFKQSITNNDVENQFHLKEHTYILDSIYNYTINRQKSWDDSTKLNCKKAIQRSAIFVNLGFQNGHLFALLQYEKKYIQYAEVFYALIEFDQDLNYLNFYIKPKYNINEVNNIINGLTFNDGKLWLIDYSKQLYLQAYHLNPKKHFLEAGKDTFHIKPLINNYPYNIQIMANQRYVTSPIFKSVFHQQNIYIAQFPFTLLLDIQTKKRVDISISEKEYLEQIIKQDLNNQAIEKSEAPLNPSLLAVDNFNQLTTLLTYDSLTRKLMLYEFNIAMKIEKISSFTLNEWLPNTYYALKGNKVYELKKNGQYFNITLLAFS
ncbi:MAG: hypothetical protein Q8K70_02255 [Bacteroidota bacterium]|nr:hypothetical protein [Bacteroidota bacterium]